MMRAPESIESASSYLVTQNKLIEYARSTNDPNSTYRQGIVAHPAFSIVPTNDTLDEVSNRILTEQMRDGVLPVHGEHDILIRQAIRPNSEVFTRSQPIGIHQKRSGTAVIIASYISDEAGKVIIEQYLTWFLINAFLDPWGQSAPERSYPPGAFAQRPTGKIHSRIEEGQTHPYAEASEDYSPMHLDDDVAREAGLDGIIVQGMLTLAIACGLLVERLLAGDGARVSRLAGRFSKMIRPGTDITVPYWHVRPTATLDRVGFEVVPSDEKDAVLTRGLMEFR